MPPVRTNKKKDLPESVAADNVQKRRALALKVGERVSSNSRFDLSQIFPVDQRNLPLTWTDGRAPETYLPFRQLLATYRILEKESETPDLLPLAPHTGSYLPNPLHKTIRALVRPFFIKNGDISQKLLLQLVPEDMKAGEPNADRLIVLTKELRGTKNDMRSNMIVKKMKPIAMAFILNPAFVADGLQWVSFGNRRDFWVARMAEIPALLPWFYQSIDNVINL